MLHEAKMYSWALKTGFLPLPGSAFAFLVVLHLPAVLELRRAGSGGLQLLGSIGKLAESHIDVATIILQ